MKDYMKDPIYQISKMPDSTDQDGIEEDKRELEQEDRLKKIEDFLFTTSRGDKTLEDLITRIVNSS
tara:strand:- start:1708 stop:1905 length:198 start_codon:yes stop_codon:yes gene_type:complete